MVEEMKMHHCEEFYAGKAACRGPARRSIFVRRSVSGDAVPTTGFVGEQRR